MKDLILARDQATRPDMAAGPGFLGPGAAA